MKPLRSRLLPVGATLAFVRNYTALPARLTLPEDLPLRGAVNLCDHGAIAVAGALTGEDHLHVLLADLDTVPFQALPDVLGVDPRVDLQVLDFFTRCHYAFTVALLTFSIHTLSFIRHRTNIVKP